MNNFPTILKSGANLLLNLVHGIINNLPQIATSVVKVIAQFIATVGQNLPKVLREGYTIIGQLAAGLIKAIPEVIKSIPKIIKSIVDTFTSYDWLKIGVNILEGIRDGMFNALSSVIDAAKEAAEGIMNGIKDFFDIASPSKKMRWVGEMIDAGLAKGIHDNDDMVDDAINKITDIGAISTEASLNLSGRNDTNNGTSVIINMYVYGAAGQDVSELADIVADRLNFATNQQIRAWN
jgi:phage-related protein